MDSRERFFRTIKNEAVDKPASWLGLPTSDAIPGLLKYFKTSTLEELKLKINDDVWPVAVPYNNPPHYDIGCALNFTKAGPGGSQDERTLTAPGFFEDYENVADVKKFNWPNPKDYISKEESLIRVASIPSNKISMAFMWSAHFQDACSAFGMEKALLVSMMNPEMFQAVVDRIVEFHLQSGEVFYEATKGKLDAVAIGNDFGSQAALMISPEFLREFILPGTKKLIDQAKSYGLTVMHHSCGSIFPIIGDIFDIGADIVHPIQALAADMQPKKLKENFYGKGAFCGGVDAQELLVNGRPNQVSEKVEELKSIFPTGLVISPSHEAILPDINPANIEAIFKSLN